MSTIKLYVLSEGQPIPATDDEVRQAAIDTLQARMIERGTCVSSPALAKDLARLMLAARDREVFMGLFLDAQHRLICAEELAQGTIDAAAVYPREVAKAALRHGATGVVFAHNHPSGSPEPSRADEALTRRLRDALALFDVRVLDHLIVGDSVVSLSERGLI